MGFDITARDVERFRRVPNRLNGVERRIDQIQSRMKKRKQSVEKNLLIPEPTARDIAISLAGWSAGAATAWLLHDKAPSINVAAGAAGACKIGQSLGLDKAGHGIIIGAGGGWGTRYLQKNVPMASLPLPTIGFADLYTTLIDEVVLTASHQIQQAKNKKAKKSKKKKRR